MFPVELLSEILSWYFEIHTPADNKSNSLSYRDNASLKPSWHAVEPLSLVSRAVRRMTLEAWFRVFQVHDPEHLEDLSPIPEVASWTRTVHWITPLGIQSTSDAANFRPEIGYQYSLDGFHRLRKLRYDANDGFFSPFMLNAVARPLPPLVEFEMRYHMWPGPKEIIPVALSLPHLRVLELHQETMWCSLCNLCAGLQVTEVPPHEIVYTKGEGLPKIYNHYLACLEHLRTVRLSVAYTITKREATSLQRLKTPWRGECGECTARMLTDEEFVEEWEAKNRDQQRPPSLREVVWTFTPKSSFAEHDTEGTSGDCDTEAEDETDGHDVYSDGSSDSDITVESIAADLDDNDREESPQDELYAFDLS